jgi:hypothetical protein
MSAIDSAEYTLKSSKYKYHNNRVTLEQTPAMEVAGLTCQLVDPYSRIVHALAVQQP